MNFAERLENRVTVFDQRVIYPCIAKPLKDVPRSILDVFFVSFTSESALYQKEGYSTTCFLLLNINQNQKERNKKCQNRKKVKDIVKVKVKIPTRLKSQSSTSSLCAIGKTSDT